MSGESRGRCVIFLDIDGVVVPVSPMSFGGGDIDSSCMGKLKQIVAASGGPDAVTIVLSSTWRHDPVKIERLNKAFDSIGGIPHTKHGVPDGTKHPPTVVTYFKKDLQEQKLVRDRVDEIYEWIDEHKDTFPEAAIGGRWFAVDDMNLGVDLRMKDHFIKSDTEDGLQSGDVKVAEVMIAALPAYTPVAAAGAAVVVEEAQTTAISDAAPATVSSEADASTAENQGATKQSTARVQVKAFAPSPATIAISAQRAAAAAAAAADPNTPVSTMAHGEPLLYNVEYVGIVKRYNPNRGFGFLTAPNNEDVFLHQSMISHLGFRAVNVGEMVCFYITDEPIPNKDGTMSTPPATRRQAIQVRQLTPYIPTNIQRQVMAQWDLYQQPYVGGGSVGAAPVVAPFAGGGGAAGKKRSNKGPTSAKGAKIAQTAAAQGEQPSATAATAHVDPNTTLAATTNTATTASAGSQYHGPGTRGRGSLYSSQLPLIPDGFGYRAVNGTVFFPAALQQQQQPILPTTVVHQQHVDNGVPSAAPAQPADAVNQQNRRMNKKGKQ